MSEAEELLTSIFQCGIYDVRTLLRLVKKIDMDMYDLYAEVSNGTSTAPPDINAYFAVVLEKLAHQFLKQIVK